MIDAPIWTVADLVAFTHHEDQGVRAWAFRRLVRHHPDDAACHAVRGISDPSWSVVGRALDALDGRPISAEIEKALTALGRRRGLPPGVRARAARLLRGEAKPARMRDPMDDEIDRLARAPDELRRRAPKMLASDVDHDRATALFALQEQQHRWATEMVLERLPALLSTADYTNVWDTFLELGDPLALQAVLDAWRPGERRIARVAVQLHALASRSSSEALPPELVRDAQEAAKLLHEMEQRLVRGLDPESPEGALRLDLRCTKCQRVGEYDVRHAWIHPDMARCREEGWDGVALGRIVVCKYCGAEDAYELTANAQVLLMGSTLRLVDESDRPGPVSVGVLGMWDGSTCKRPSEAIRHLQELAERDPERGEGWRRLGNLCERYDRVDQAVAAWTRAAEDENEMEACYSLAKHHVDLGHTHEAFTWAAKTIERIRGGKDAQPAEIRRDAADLALGIVRLSLSRSREPLALRASWLGGAGDGGQVMLDVSVVDLRSLRRWDRLVDLFASDAFIGAQFTNELPEERSTLLGRMLESNAPIGALSAARGPARAAPKTGRNDPCPCGSGKKFKKCCGR